MKKRACTSFPTMRWAAALTILCLQSAPRVFAAGEDNVIPDGVPNRFRTPGTSTRERLVNDSVEKVGDWLGGGFPEVGGPPARQVQGRPGYRPHMTKRAWQFYQMYKKKYEETGGNPGFGYNLTRLWLTSQRQWPEAPHMDDKRAQAVREYEQGTDALPEGAWYKGYSDDVRAATRHYTIHGQGLGGYDIGPSANQEIFIERYHNTPPKERPLAAQLYMSSLRASGVDCRPKAMRDQDTADVRAQREEINRRRAEREERERLNQQDRDTYDRAQEFFEQVRAEEARQRLLDAIRRSREEGPEGPAETAGKVDSEKTWNEMSAEERHDALKNNEPDAWEAAVTDLFGADGKGALDSVVAEHDERSSETSKAGLEGMETQSDMETSSTAGDKEMRDAELALNTAGSEAQQTMAQSSADTAKGQADQSWGKAVADGVQEGLEEGGRQTGRALGAAAADKVADDIFNKDDHKDDESDEDGTPAGGKTQVAGKTTDVKADAASDENTSPASPSDKSRKKSSGGKKIRKKDHDKEHVEYETAKCAFCGYTAKFPKGKRPSHCPKCGCGPNMDLVECSNCGAKYFIKSGGGGPGRCKKCGAGGKSAGDDGDSKKKKQKKKDKPKKKASSGNDD